MGQGEETDLFLQNVIFFFVASTDSIVVLCMTFHLCVGWKMIAIIVLVTVTVLKTKQILRNPMLVVMMVKAKKRIVTRRIRLPQFS